MMSKKEPNLRTKKEGLIWMLDSFKTEDNLIPIGNGLVRYENSIDLEKSENEEVFAYLFYDERKDSYFLTSNNSNKVKVSKEKTKDYSYSDTLSDYNNNEFLVELRDKAEIEINGQKLIYKEEIPLQKLSSIFNP